MVVELKKNEICVSSTFQIVRRKRCKRGEMSLSQHSEQNRLTDLINISGKEMKGSDVRIHGKLHDTPTKALIDRHKTDRRSKHPIFRQKMRIFFGLYCNVPAASAEKSSGINIR